MSNRLSWKTKPYYLAGLISFGIFAGAIALSEIPPNNTQSHPARGLIWNVFQYGLPLIIAGGVCLIRKRWVFIMVVIYGTIGLALDLATLAQSIAKDFDPAIFLVIIITTSILNFSLIVIGGKCLLQTITKDIQSQI